MYKCHDCGSEFEQPYQYKENHGFMDGWAEIFTVCPDCGSGRFEEIIYSADETEDEDV